MTIPDSLINSLRETLVSSDTFTPQDEGYEAAITRWSGTGRKEAVPLNRITK